MRPLLAAALVGLSAAAALAQAAVPFHAEPHHTQLLYTAHLRMFDVTVAPGATTLDHGHDHDVVTIALGATTFRTRLAGQDWAQPRSYDRGSVNIVEYTGTPAVHRMENVGTTPYRVFAVENLRDAGWSTPAIVNAPASTLLEQSRSFAVYGVRLSTSVPRTSHVHQMPTVVILVSGTVEVQGGGGESEFRMESAGRWFASQWDQPHTLTLIGGGEAQLIEVEAR